MSNYFVLGTPGAVQQYIPDFDRPIQNGPFLVIIFPDSRAFVLERQEAVGVLMGIVAAMDQVIGNIELVAPPPMTQAETA